jgi:hypothetical protein
MNKGRPVYCYAVPSELTSPRFAAAFAKGCGGVVVEDGSLRPGPLALFGSPKLMPQLHQAAHEGRDWYYGDHAFFGRMIYYRVARGTYHYDGSPDAVEVDRGRAARLGIEVRPWRRSGRHVLVCPPDAALASYRGFNSALWLDNVLAELQAATDREIRVRDRSLARMGARRSLADDLADCWALVTHSSNAAVEAAVMGIPVFVTAPCGASWVASGLLDRIEYPRKPDDREEWVDRLAAHQWTMGEIASGQAWAALRH